MSQENVNQDAAGTSGAQPGPESEDTPTLTPLGDGMFRVGGLLRRSAVTGQYVRGGRGKDDQRRRSERSQAHDAEGPGGGQAPLGRWVWEEGRWMWKSAEGLVDPASLTPGEAAALREKATQEFEQWQIARMEAARAEWAKAREERQARRAARGNKRGSGRPEGLRFGGGKPGPEIGGGTHSEGEADSRGK